MHRSGGMLLLSILLASAAIASNLPLASPTSARVRLVTDEADAAVAILRLRAGGKEVPAAAWDRLWSSEAFRRLKKRQESFGATDVEAAMKEYLLSPEALAAASDLAAALGRWQALDVAATAVRAGAYLPAGTVLRATIYPVIKRSENR